MGDHGFTAAELAACAEREVKQRERVYPRLVADKKMSQAFADQQLAMMRAIAGEYGDLARGDVSDLFIAQSR